MWNFIEYHYTFVLESKLKHHNEISRDYCRSGKTPFWLKVSWFKNPKMFFTCIPTSNTMVKLAVNWRWVVFCFRIDLNCVFSSWIIVQWGGTLNKTWIFAKIHHFVVFNILFDRNVAPVYLFMMTCFKFIGEHWKICTRLSGLLQHNHFTEVCKLLKTRYR